MSRRENGESKEEILNRLWTDFDRKKDLDTILDQEFVNDVIYRAMGEFAALVINDAMKKFSEVMGVRE